jgi:hypothetical protein
VLLLVCPMYAEPPSEHQLEKVAARFPNVVVCAPDGSIRYRLQDNGALLEGLRGRQPRAFAPLLLESDEASVEQRNIVQLLRNFCPDVLAELLLHLDAQFEPAVVLAEYIFMLRPFPLLRPGVLKAVDTIDVFSSKNAKVERFGVADQLSLSAAAEVSLLQRADVVIGIQPAETELLRALVPNREVITVGVDFPVADGAVSRPCGIVVAMVGSANPLNVKGLRDFLRFAWPLVVGEIPEAQFHVAGDVAAAIEPHLPGVRLLGRVENVSDVYSAARVIINPAIAGTGLKVKTVEAICHGRAVVLWPAGAEGLPVEATALCDIANDWHEFARLVIKHLGAEEPTAEATVNIAHVFASDRVYAALEEALSPA